MEEEIWKDIPEYEGLYQAGSIGNIKSFRKLNERILSPGSDRNSYKYVFLYSDTKKCIMVHQLVAKTFIPNPGNKPTINHINGIKTDNRVANLEWCTYSENHKHAFNTGLRERKGGEKANCAKLTRFQIESVRRLHRLNPKFSRVKVAEKLGIKAPYVSQIISYKVWKQD